jgi:U3 small nucleolar RNA-associated protein 12
MDAASGMLVFDEAAHAGAVNSMMLRPDGKGFVSASSDKMVRFWEFSVNTSSSNALASTLAAEVTRELQMSHDALCVRYSSTPQLAKRMVAIGLLDHTVQVFYEDSLKFFLSLYGHKLPVLCCDFSSDGKILASGSADKTIKIWGMDFGDCHRSLLAHQDSVTSLRFQPDTHYFFSCGKDGMLKYWDADRFEQILQLPGHGPGSGGNAVWACELSYDASICVTVGQDRSLRLWQRSEDMVFVEEEKERELEAMVDSSLQQQQQQQQGEDTIAAKTSETVRGGEALIAALDVVEEEIDAIIAWHRLHPDKPRQASLKLLGLSPQQYFLRSLRQIKAPDLEQALLVLPFHEVQRMVAMLLQLARQGLEIELCTRCAVLLLRCHQQQIITTRSLLDQITALRQVLCASIASYRTLLGTNLAGMKMLTAITTEKMMSFGPSSEELQLSAANSGRSKKKKSKKTSTS